MIDLSVVVCALCLFLVMPWVSLQSMSVAYSILTYWLIFNKILNSMCVARR